MATKVSTRVKDTGEPFGIRLPKSVFAQMEEYRQESILSRGAVIAVALNQYLGTKNPQAAA